MENKFARFMRNTGPARFLLPVGLILIVVGIILFGVKTDNYLETEGRITAVTENEAMGGEADQQTTYDVAFVYTVDGKEYNGTFTGLTGSYKTGDAIKVYYDPSDLNKITNGKMGAIIPIVMIGIGVLALIFGVFTIVRAFGKSKALDAAGSFPAAAFEGFKNAAGVTEYYFRFDGHALKPGYIIEDADRKVLFEGKMTKQALVGARSFDFVDHTTGRTTAHEVGHTVTQNYDDGLFSTKSWFKVDGKNVWDLLHEKGIRIKTDLRSQFPYGVYEAAKDNAPFVRIESSSIYVHEEEEAEHAAAIPMGKMYYRFWTASNDFETLFLTIFAISETQQVVVE